MRLKHSNCPVEFGDKLVDHWVGFDFSEDKNPNTKTHIKLFNDGYTQWFQDIIKSKELIINRYLDNVQNPKNNLVPRD